MKNWNNFINEEYRDEIPPKYMEKIIEFINDILKENGLSWNEYLEIEEYVDSLSRDELGDGGLNLYINSASTNALIARSNFKASDLVHAKIIINELTDLYKLYPNDLLKGIWKNDDLKNYSGYCYVATEALWWMLGGPDSQYTPYVLGNKDWPEVLKKGETHWFLKSKVGKKIIYYIL